MDFNRDKVIFSVLKELEEGRVPTFNDYGLEKEPYGEIIESMIDDKLIKKAQVVRSGIGNSVTYVVMHHARVTSEGREYLERNTRWAKTYK